MALLLECTPSFAQKVFDTADIVREAIFRQLPRRSVNSGFAGRRLPYVYDFALYIKRAIPKKFWHVFHIRCIVLLPTVNTVPNLFKELLVSILKLRSLHVCLLLLMTTGFAVSASATTFTKASVKGSYSYLINSWTADSTVNEDATVGVLTSDGAGNVSDTFTHISGGVVNTGTVTGTYTVNANGTGTANFPAAPATVYTFVLDSSAAALAKGFYLLLTNNSSNVVLSGTGILQTTAAATYTASSVKGNFAFQINKWTANSTAAQTGVLGIFIIDGAGHVKGSYSAMNNGVFVTATFTGTYTVSPDGNGSMSLSASDGSTPVLAFALNTTAPTAPYTAKGLQFMVTNETSNTAHSGTALKQ